MGGDVYAHAHHTASLTLAPQLREMWDTWDIRDDVQGDDCLQYDSFYNGFLSPYFGCFRCEDTRQAMQAIDMDADGLVDWNEFMVYIKWALRQYPRIDNIDELLSVAFNKGLIPAECEMRLSNKHRRQSNGGKLLRL